MQDNASFFIFLNSLAIWLIQYFQVVAKGKTVTIRVSEETFDEIREVCSSLGEAYNFNQFVNQSLGAILEVIKHDGEEVPIPKFAMMARWLKDYEPSEFTAKGNGKGGGST